jgi:hypothetical protein
MNPLCEALHVTHVPLTLSKVFRRSLRLVGQKLQSKSAKDEPLPAHEWSHCMGASEGSAASDAPDAASARLLHITRAFWTTARSLERLRMIVPSDHAIKSFMSPSLNCANASTL